MAVVAQQMGVTVNGSPVHSFSDIKKWWLEEQAQQDEQTKNTIY
jgi:hypothetical protein